MNYENQDYDVLDDKYNLVKTIGVGATASVKMAHEIGKSEEVYAIKLLKNSDVKMKAANLKHFKSEIDTLKKLSHENIINLVDSGDGTVRKLNGIIKQKNYIVLEYAANCELFDFIYFAKKGLGEYISKGLFKQLLSGLDFCHKSGVAHRDLKTENLMLTDKWVLKIADFGYATNIEGKNESHLLSTFLGSLAYASPEVINKKFYLGAPSDIFSTGVILFILVTGKLPFGKAAVQDSCYRNFIRKDPEAFWKMMEPRLDEIPTQEFKSIINAIFTYDADQRIKMEDLINHEWLKSNFASNEEIGKELESRRGEVQQMKELEQQQLEDENIEAYGVYRSGKLDAADCNRDNIVRECRNFVKTNNPYKLLIKSKNSTSLYYDLLSYFDRDVTKDKKIEKDSSYLRFNVNFNLNAEAKELMDNGILIKSLNFDIEVKRLNDMECIIEWRKLKGDKLEFFENFQKFIEQY